MPRVLLLLPLLATGCLQQDGFFTLRVDVTIPGPTRDEVRAEYPLLLSASRTVDGETTLIDRQTLCSPPAAAGELPDETITLTNREGETPCTIPNRITVTLQAANFEDGVACTATTIPANTTPFDPPLVVEWTKGELDPMCDSNGFDTSFSTALQFEGPLRDELDTGDI